MRRSLTVEGHNCMKPLDGTDCSDLRTYIAQAVLVFPVSMYADPLAWSINPG